MPKFWKDSLDYLGPLLTLIVKSGNLEASTRVRALDLLCSLSERCPTRLRRSPWVAQDLLPTLLSILCVPPAGDLQVATQPTFHGGQGSEKYPMWCPKMLTMGWMLSVPGVGRACGLPR